VLELREEYVEIGLEAPDAAAVIEALSARLHASGAVEAGYAAATIAREQAHPTGLPTQPFAIAIPHADADGVVRSALAFASLAEPVTFKNMADWDEELAVELVVLLANNSPEEQVRALQNLATIFGQAELLQELRSLTTPAQVVAWFKERSIAG